MKFVIVLTGIFVLGFVLGLVFIDKGGVTGRSIYDFSDQGGIIEIPVRVFIVSDDSDYYTSHRDERGIFELFRKANGIWSASDIEFIVSGIERIYVDFNTVPGAINGHLDGLKEFSDEGISVFFVQSLNGINGIALREINSIMISDYTGNVNDYRTLAHELGHLLDLRHVEDSRMLMAQGKNGEILDLREIQIARERARFFSN